MIYTSFLEHLTILGHTLSTFVTYIRQTTKPQSNCKAKAKGKPIVHSKQRYTTSNNSLTQLLSIKLYYIHTNLFNSSEGKKVNG